ASQNATYGGSVAATEKVTFRNICRYEVTLKNVAMKLVVLPSGDIDKATVQDVMDETASECDKAGLGAHNQEFTLKSSSKTTTGMRLEFTGSAMNVPKTVLVVDLVKTDDGYKAAATWTRVDQGLKTLNWTVTSTVDLKRE